MIRISVLPLGLAGIGVTLIGFGVLYTPKNEARANLSKVSDLSHLIVVSHQVEAT
jgi:hypothetical protein